MSLLNQSGNLHNKLSDYGDVLAGLRNGDSAHNTGNRFENEKFPNSILFNFNLY